VKASIVRFGGLAGLFLVVLSMMICSSFCSAYSFQVGFNSKFKTDQKTCTGGKNQVNAGVVDLFVRKGRSCEDGSGWFYEVVCNNSGDLLKTIPPGGEAVVKCVLDSTPFEDGAPNCVMVKWCGQEATIDHDKTKCKEGECNCDASKLDEMTCCSGGKMSPANSKTFCGKCAENQRCAGLVVQSASDVCDKCCVAGSFECHMKVYGKGMEESFVHQEFNDPITSCEVLFKDGYYNVTIIANAAREGEAEFTDPTRIKSYGKPACVCEDDTLPERCSAKTKGKKCSLASDPGSGKEYYTLVDEKTCEEELTIKSVPDEPKAVLEAVVKDKTGKVLAQGKLVEIVLDTDVRVYMDPIKSTIPEDQIKDWWYSKQGQWVTRPAPPPLEGYTTYFGNPGSYTMKLIVDLKNGGALSDTVTVNVKEPPLQPECKSVVNKGISKNKLDLVFIPGTYSTPTEDQKKILLEDFEGMVREYYQTLIGIKPFDTYVDRINIWFVNEVVESCSVNSEGQLICPQTDAENKCPNDRRIYIITNLPGTANAPSPRVYINYDPSKKKVFVHELGHILGKQVDGLSDEYVNSDFYDHWIKDGVDMDKYVTNSINCDTDTSCSKWTDSSKSSYVKGAGCFQNCSYTNAYYRSAENCIMNHQAVTDAFCPVCSKYIDQYFKELAYLNP
jgi:hypothetical protein